MVNKVNKDKGHLYHSMNKGYSVWLQNMLMNYPDKVGSFVLQQITAEKLRGDELTLQLQSEQAKGTELSKQFIAEKKRADEIDKHFQEFRSKPVVEKKIAEMPFQVFLDYGEGFSEENSLIINYETNSRATVEGEITLKKQLINVRIDPTSKVGSLKIFSLRLFVGKIKKYTLDTDNLVGLSTENFEVLPKGKAMFSTSNDPKIIIPFTAPAGKKLKITSELIFEETNEYVYLYLNKLETAKQKKQLEIAQNTQALQEKAESIRVKENLLSEKDDQLNTLSGRLRDKISMLSHTEEQLKEKQIENVALVNQFKAEKARADELDKHIPAIQAQSEEVVKQLQAEQVKRNELSNQFKTEKIKADELDKHIHDILLRSEELAKQYHAEQSKNNELSNELKAENARADELDKHIQTIQARSQEVVKQLQTDQARTVDLVTQLAGKRVINEKLKGTLAESVAAKRSIEEYLNRQFYHLSFRRVVLPIAKKILFLIITGKIFQAWQLLNSYTIIRRSNLFDPIYYLEQNRDVSSANIDPLLHYLLNGSLEQRKTSALFDTAFYLEQHPEVGKKGINPLLHYIRYGREAGYKTSPLLNPSQSPNEKMHPFDRPALSRASGVSIIIPTYNGGKLFQNVLEAIVNQDFSGPRELIVVDSGSNDGTDILAERYGATVKRISKKEFHHSRTRQLALSFTQYDRVVYMVQDAIPMSKTWLQIIYGALDDKVAAAFGRQIPHHDAELYARFEIDNHSEYLGNVPRIQCATAKKQVSSYQEELYQYRFDDVCSIYWRKVLDVIPFPDTPYAEDMAWARTVIQKGMCIRYSPDIQTYHSHNRTSNYRFKRTIVDNVICAEILNKLEQDLRPAGISEIKALEEFCKRLLAEKISRFDSSPNRRNKSFKKTFFEQGFAESLKYVGKPSSKIISAVDCHVNFLLNLIAQRYPEVTDDEFRSCIPQVIAVSQGLIVGRIYASYLLNHEVPADLDEYVRPLMVGV
jgi:glycosyltransferase involved in cell wall biosynthesis